MSSSQSRKDRIKAIVRKSKFFFIKTNKIYFKYDISKENKDLFFPFYPILQKLCLACLDEDRPYNFWLTSYFSSFSHLLRHYDIRTEYEGEHPQKYVQIGLVPPTPNRIAYENSDEVLSDESELSSPISKRISKIRKSSKAVTRVDNSCYICKGKGASLIDCREEDCDKLYHRKCLEDNNYPFELKRDEKTIRTCPLHICLTCFNAQRSTCLIKKFIKCKLCPTVYHHIKSCIPIDSVLNDFEDFFCSEHTKTTNKRPININWCYTCHENGKNLDYCSICPAAFHSNDCWIELRTDHLKGKLLKGKNVCHNCSTGKKLHYGDIVWVSTKDTNHWWPGEIKYFDEVPDDDLKGKHSNGDFPVYLFGTHTYEWSNSSQTFLFRENDDKSDVMLKSSRSGQFKTALIEAARHFKVLMDARRRIHESFNPDFELISENLSFNGIKPKPVKLGNVKSKCGCEKSNACQFSCPNAEERIECNDKICSNGKSCKNRQFTNRDYADIELFYNQITCVWGVRAVNKIEENRLVIEYIGELIDKRERDRRLRQIEKFDDKNYHYFYYLNKDLIIDAGQKGNLGRFINHSSVPNCVFDDYIVDQEIRIGIFSREKITRGQELTLNFGNF